MKTASLRRRIKKLIANTELEITFSILKILYENKNPEVFKELIILQGQYQHLRNTKELSLEQEMRDIRKIVAELELLTKQLRKEYERKLPEELASQLTRQFPNELAKV